MQTKYILLIFISLINQASLAAPTIGSTMMVATPSTLSAQVAEEIMQKRGNVVDVAVSIALTLAVTNPRHAALGGGGFAMIKMGKNPIEALDFRETAPQATNKDYYINKAKNASQDGPHAVGVPGIPAGLWALHKKYGKIHWSILFDTPIKLAQYGHHITGENIKRINEAKGTFNKAGKSIFLDKKGNMYKPGDLLIQKNLASALKLMRNRGIVAFYEGVIGRDIVDTIKKEGGVLNREDLKAYKVRWLKPIVTNLNAYKIYLMPPPSSGGLVIASSLKMLEKLNMDKVEPLSTLEFHYFAEVMKINFRNRNLLGDPAFNKNPTEEFLDNAKISEWVSKIKPDEILKIDPIKDLKTNESNETTHFSVLDKDGNAVSMTITLNGDFGSKLVSEKFGIALNNEMDDFTTNPNEANLYGLTQGTANSVEPGKRPLSSMSPTLVEKNNKVVMALGAPGGPRIITGVLQSLYRVLVRGDNMEQAIFSPRVHHQFSPDILYIDKKKLPPLSIEALEKLGYKTETSWGSIVNGVRVNKDGNLEAAFDYRSEGGAGGF
jgi:gamma-glutamyltranspeptidase / glutathione hydrolase